MSNISVFNKGVRDYAKRLELRVESVLSKVAEDVVIYIESGAAIPVQTGNLQDSTGVGIYRNGSLRKYIPVKIAQEQRDGKWGSDELLKALSMASTDFVSGVWICLFSTMPYAMKIDEKYNYFDDDVVADMVRNVKSRLHEIK